MESKVKALIKKLKEIKDEDATAKSLVFSHFQATIDWLKSRLSQAGFSYRTLSGDMSLSQRAKALQEFQNDPPTTVFLLSIRSGACGINLTQANQVFLMEPCLNPALEKQAIGRVHRMGQKRVVKVWKLVMKNSVEENVIKVTEKLGENTVVNDGASDVRHDSGAGTGESDAKKSKLVVEDLTTQVGSISRDRASLKLQQLELLLS